MSDWLDLIGSVIIGGLVILMITNFKLSINSAAIQNLHSNVIQRQVVSSTEVIEHDMYKVGYRINGDVIIEADSNEIRFLSDIDNNGTADEIRYYLTGTSSMSGSFNPGDRILWRKLNNETTSTPLVITELNFSYYDSLGQFIDYNMLNNQLSRNTIKSVKVKIECQTGELINDKFEKIEWEKTIRPKNI